MKINQIIALVAVIILGALIIFTGGEKGQRVASASSLVAESLEYDFGDIDIFGGDVSVDYNLTNTGNEDIIVTSGVTSCGCTKGVIGGQDFGMHFDMKEDVTIPAGETTTLTAIYDPLAHGPTATGAVTRMVKIMTNSTETPELEVRFSANVVKSNNVEE